MRGWSETEIVTAWFRAEDPFELTIKEDNMRRRWMAARAYFLQLLSYAEVVENLQRDFTIGIAQARVDIRNMQAVFGEIEKVTKDAHRARAIEMALKTFKTAELTDDTAGMAAATKTYILATGIDKDDPEKVDLEKIMRERIYVEALDEDVRNLLLNFMQQSGGLVDGSKLFEGLYAAKKSDQFIDYEMLPNDGATDPGTD